MAKTAVDSFKGGRDVKYLRAAYGYWGTKCVSEGRSAEDPPSDDEIWQWFTTFFSLGTSYNIDTNIRLV